MRGHDTCPEQRFVENNVVPHITVSKLFLDGRDVFKKGRRIFTYRMYMLSSLHKKYNSNGTFHSKWRLGLSHNNFWMFKTSWFILERVYLAESSNFTCSFKNVFLNMQYLVTNNRRLNISNETGNRFWIVQSADSWAITTCIYALCFSSFKCI